MRKPLHCIELSQTFLVYEKSEIRERLLKTIIDRSELKCVIANYRKHGYAIDDEENDVSVYCLPSPIFGEEDNMIAVISCAGLKLRILEK